jgi:hypothetical protein
MTYANGDRYEGSWRDGKRNGSGTYYRKNGDRYKVPYKVSFFSFILNHSLHLSLVLCRMFFQGDWEDDKRHGIGRETFENCDRYEGQYRNDRFDGRICLHLFVHVFDVRLLRRLNEYRGMPSSLERS